MKLFKKNSLRKIQKTRFFSKKKANKTRVLFKITHMVVLFIKKKKQIFSNPADSYALYAAFVVGRSFPCRVRVFLRLPSLPSRLLRRR